MDFSDALRALKEGKSVTRGFNKSGMIVTAQFPDENSKMTNPYFFLTIPGDVSDTRTPWWPSNLDLWATDWEEIIK